nr:MAG TPA: hypothetical protein [Caudoviricetes sp.]
MRNMALMFGLYKSLFFHHSPVVTLQRSRF